MEERISRRRFIRLGTVLGVGAAGASVLAACGGGESGGGGGGESGGGAGGGAGGGEDATKSSGEKASGTAGKKAPGGQEIASTPAVLVHLKSGDFVAYSAVCTHQGCTVAFNNGQLACPCHGSVFDPAHGAAVVAGPAPRPLPEIPVEVRGGEVFRA